MTRSKERRQERAAAVYKRAKDDTLGEVLRILEAAGSVEGAKRLVEMELMELSNG